MRGWGAWRGVRCPEPETLISEDFMMFPILWRSSYLKILPVDEWIDSHIMGLITLNLTMLLKSHGYGWKWWPSGNPRTAQMLRHWTWLIVNGSISTRPAPLDQQHVLRCAPLGSPLDCTKAWTPQRFRLNRKGPPGNEARITWTSTVEPEIPCGRTTSNHRDVLHG